MIGIDSMILIYAGLAPRKSSKKTKALENLHVRAKLLLHMRRKETIVIPAIAVSEILVPVPADQRGALAARITDRFLCPSFDLKAAAIAAHIWSERKRLESSIQYKNRVVLRADMMIVASAYAAGATEFFSNDKLCRKLADIVMKGCELPTDDPDDMFLKGDIERGDV